MTTPNQPTSYNDLKRLAGEALTQAVTEELKTHTETLKETNRRANWQDQRIADLSDKLRGTQIWLTFSFALIIILTVISSFLR